jgi:hypothetical protein
MRRIALACIAAVGMALPGIVFAAALDGSDAPETIRGTAGADSINDKGATIACSVWPAPTDCSGRRATTPCSVVQGVIASSAVPAPTG